jgi:hypothetical protein
MSFVSAAVNIGGAFIQSGAAGDAAEAQVNGANQANALQEKIWNETKGMYNQQRADQEPWRQAGLKALTGLGDADYQRDFSAADFTKDPGYEFRMAEGQKALERSAAARGGLQTGGTLKALTKYGQDYASNEYNNAYTRFNADRDRRFNRLSSLAGFGQQANAQNAAANAQQGQFAQNYAGTVGNNLMGIGNAQGAASIAKGNAWSGALSNIEQNWMERQEMAMKAGSKLMGGA